MKPVTVLLLVLPLFFPLHASASSLLVTKHGSLSPRLKDTVDLGPRSSAESHRIVVGLSLRNREQLEAFLRDVQDPASPRYRQFLTQEHFNAVYAPTPQDEEGIVAYLERSGFQITDRFPNRLTIGATGDVAAIERAFGVRLHSVLYHGKMHFAALKDPSLPASLASAVVGVIELDDLHQMHARIRRGAPAPRSFLGSSCCRLGPSDLRIFYDNQFGFDGDGQTVVIAGAFAWKDSDVETFDAQWGLPALPAGSGQICAGPATSMGCQFNGSNSDEVSLDVEYVHGTAPGAVILNYMAASTSNADFTSMYNRIVTDNPGHVVTTSWGTCELGLSPSAQQVSNDIFVNANAIGQSWFSASGDDGSQDCDGLTNVDHPANSPHVIGVGGTTPTCSDGLDASNPLCAGYGSETAWDGSGGGASEVFSRPSFQKNCGVPAGTQRLVPDVALEADPTPGNYVFANGAWFSVGGTSIATPQWAGFFAELNQQMGGSGLGNPGSLLYGKCGTSAFHDITSGSNGDFDAGPGYDMVTGLGSIDARNMISPQSPPPPPPPPVQGIEIEEAKIVGDPAFLVAGCPARQTLVAVAVHGFGVVASVGGNADLNGVPVGRVNLRPTSLPPPGAGALVAGQIFSARLGLRLSAPGTLEIDLVAADRARNISEPFALTFPVMANAPPFIGAIATSGTIFQSGEAGTLHIEANLSDDCAVRSAGLEIDRGDGRGFRRAASLVDSGRNGDATPADGVWSGNALLTFSAPGSYSARITVQDALGLTAQSSPFTLAVN